MTEETPSKIDTLSLIALNDQVVFFEKAALKLSQQAPTGTQLATSLDNVYQRLSAATAFLREAIEESKKETEKKE